jgi:predicted RNA-binding Zn ribbon-like protein
MGTSDSRRRGPAPGELAIVQAFVNSAEVDGDRDELDSPARAREWFVAQGLLEPAARVDDGDVVRAVAVREALRDVLEGNGGPDVPAAAVEELNRAAAAARMGRPFGEGGEMRTPRGAPTVDDALGTILLLVARAQAAGTWARLKVCPAGDCRWAFYDRSRNRSGTWCSMSACGSREKMRRYRGRRDAAPAR